MKCYNRTFDKISSFLDVQLLRTHSETMAPLVTAAALASSEEKNSKSLFTFTFREFERI